MTRIRKFLFCLVFCLLLLPWLCCLGEETSGRFLTVMIYMCGSDLETGYGAATRDLEEITRACTGQEEVTVLVMIGGSSRWQGETCTPDETRILEIASRGRRRIMDYPSGMNMGAAETLSMFLQYGVETRPASRYALILWDHGAGPMEGVCFDELHGMDSLSLGELKNALENSPFSINHRLAWIGFDACLMASVETAHCCKDYAEYMIASQETEPDSGWNYSFLQDIRRDETAADIGRKIVSAYMENKKKTDLLTLSLVNLRAINDLEREINGFFLKISDHLTEDTFSDLSRSRQGTKSFGRASTGSDYDLVDLYHLSEQYAPIAPEETGWIQDTLSSAVLSLSGNQENTHGLSIFFPYYNKQAFLAGWQETYRGFEFLPSYRNFLNRYSAVWTGEPMIRFTGLKGTASPLSEQGTQAVELVLTDEQTEHFAEASCVILEDYGSDHLYHNIFTVEQPVLEGNTLKAEYSFDALYVVDENGVVETEAIPFLIRDGYYLVYGFLEESSFLDDGMEDPLFVILRCRKDEANQELEIINVSPDNEDDLYNLGRQSIDLSSGKWKYLFLNGFRPFGITRNREGSLLPFDQWTPGPEAHMINVNPIDAEGNRIDRFQDMLTYEVSAAENTHQEYEADLSRPWKLKFLPLKTTGRNLAAQFSVRDTQGNEWGSELIPLTDPDLIASAPVISEEIDLPGCRIQPFEIRAIQNDSFRGIVLRVRARSTIGNSIWMNALDPVVNNTVCPEMFVSADRVICPEEDCILDFQLSLSDICLPEDSVIRTLSFLPRVNFLNSDTPLVTERIHMDTELDISGLLLPKRENIEVLSACTIDQVTFELIRLEEPEGGILRGRMRLANEGTESRRCRFLASETGNSPGFGINDQMMLGCVKTNKIVFLPPGTERYVDFEIIAEADRRLQVSGSGSEAWERKISQIILCGFAVSIEKNLVSFMEPASDALVEEYVKFFLKRPFFLRTPFREIYTPTEN